MRNAISAGVALALFFAIVLACSGTRTTKPQKHLTSEHRTAIDSALRTKEYPAPNELELTDDGWLVATFKLQRMPTGGLQTFAEDSLLTIREAMLPFKLTEQYRVTLNGPSPGTGLIRRYGSARFIEGDRVTWEPGIR